MKKSNENRNSAIFVIEGSKYGAKAASKETVAVRGVAKNGPIVR